MGTARILIAVVVAIAIGYTIWNAVGQLREQQFQFSQINYLWWVAAIACFIAGMTLSAIFWHRLLIAMEQQPKLKESIGAFFISQLGKYVPGKAMVVVLRTDRIRSDRVTIGPAIVSVFIETLTWLFTGSIIASVLLFFWFDNRVLQVIAVSMMVVAGVLTAPPVIRWFAHRLGHVKGKEDGQGHARIDGQTNGARLVVTFTRLVSERLESLVSSQGTAGSGGTPARLLAVSGLCNTCGDRWFRFFASRRPWSSGTGDDTAAFHPV